MRSGPKTDQPRARQGKIKPLRPRHVNCRRCVRVDELYGDLLVGSRKIGQKMEPDFSVVGVSFFYAAQIEKIERPGSGTQPNRSAQGVAAIGTRIFFCGRYRGFSTICDFSVITWRLIWANSCRFGRFGLPFSSGVGRANCPRAARGRPAHDAAEHRSDRFRRPGLDRFWIYGAHGGPTPHLDRLAARSAVFRRAMFRRAFVGRAWRHHYGALSASAWHYGKRSSAGDRSLGDAETHPGRGDTSAALGVPRGYRSFQAGKWWEGNHAEAGFTAGMCTATPSRAVATATRACGSAGGTLAGLRFINSCGRDPLFSLVRPHDAPLAPRSARAAAGNTCRRAGPWLSRYFAMCEWFDETCGELLGFLDKKGLTENTLVVFRGRQRLDLASERPTVKAFAAPVCAALEELPLRRGRADADSGFLAGEHCAGRL